MSIAPLRKSVTAKRRLENPFDSNVHISSAVYGGAALRAVQATLEAHWKIFISDTILREVHRILRQRFNYTHSMVNSTITTLQNISEIAEEVPSRHHVPGDPNDTPILRAALSASVDYLITRDKELLALNPTEGIRIITVADYLHILQSHGFAPKQ